MYKKVHFILGAIILLFLASCSPSNTIKLTVQPQNATNPFDKPGDIISYSYVVKNTGSKSLYGPVVIDDDKMQVSCPELTEVGNKNQSLDPDESITCTSTHTIVQGDIDAGSVDNNAVAKIDDLESNRVSNIIKMLQTFRKGDFVKGSTIQHIVTPGEWLLQVARCYGADFKSLQIANPQVADPTIDLEPMILTIPNIGSNGTIFGPPCIIYYTVDSDDTWQSIAIRYNADRIVLMQANSNVFLSIGAIIKVPLNSAGELMPTTMPPSPEETSALVDEILKKSYTGGLIYTTPKSMNLDETFTVELQLTPSLSDSEISSLIESGNSGTASKEPNEIINEELKVVGENTPEITPQVRAVLFSADKEAFDIQSLNVGDKDGDTHVVGSSLSTKWQWVIKARKINTQNDKPHKIYLVIYRLVNRGNVPDWQTVETYEVNVDVKTSLAQRLQAVDWKWIIGLGITLLIVPAFWRWIDNKVKKKDKQQEKASFE